MYYVVYALYILSTPGYLAELLDFILFIISLKSIHYIITIISIEQLIICAHTT